MRILRYLVTAVAALGVIVVVLYAAGVRVRLDGSGVPVLVRIQTPSDRDSRVEAHRAAQPPGGAPAAPARRAAEEADAVASASVPAAISPDVATSSAVGPMEERDTTEPAAAPETTTTGYWTQFRGPARDGHYRETPIRTAWPAEGLEPMWRQPVGGGYASFVVAGGRAFTIEQRRGEEVVAAYDVETGGELWTHAWDGEFKEWMGGDGPRATPTWSGNRVYALGALGELRCLDDRTGALVWRVNILDDNGASNLEWGMAASPLVVDGMVVVLPGGSGGRSVVAYDATTGARRWSALDDQASYSSPMLVTLAGRRQLLVVTATRLVGLTPESGELLWEFPWAPQPPITAAQPLVIGERRVLVSSSYGQGAALVEITENGGRFATRTVWRHNRLKNRFSSSVLLDGYIYGLDENILTCLDAETGETRWKAGRYGHGQFVLASGHLILLSESGELALVRANPERHEELVRFQFLEGKTWNHPALDAGRLLVRNTTEMAAFDLRVNR